MTSRVLRLHKQPEGLSSQIVVDFANLDHEVRVSGASRASGHTVGILGL